MQNEIVEIYKNKKYWILRNYILQNGPIPTVRVSSAQASGKAKNYPYWGAVRYEIRINSKGNLSNIALGRASSDRRSYRLAEEDMEILSKNENRIMLYRIGELDPHDVNVVITQLGRNKLSGKSIS